MVPEQSITSASPAETLAPTAAIVFPSTSTSAVAKSPTFRSRLSTMPPRSRILRFRPSPTRFCSSAGVADRNPAGAACGAVAGAGPPAAARHDAAPSAPASPAAPDVRMSRRDKHRSPPLLAIVHLLPANQYTNFDQPLPVGLCRCQISFYLLGTRLAAAAEDYHRQVRLLGLDVAGVETVEFLHRHPADGSIRKSDDRDRVGIQFGITRGASRARQLADRKRLVGIHIADTLDTVDMKPVLEYMRRAVGRPERFVLRPSDK